MAATMQKLVTFVVKVPFGKNPCLHDNRIAVTSVKHFAATTANEARVVRGKQEKIQPRIEDNLAKSNSLSLKLMNSSKSSPDTNKSSHSQSQRNIQTDHEGRILPPWTDRNPEFDAVEKRGSAIKYEKAGSDDKRIGRLLMLAKSRKHREKTGQVMLEGTRLITDAIDAGVQAHTIFFSHLQSLEGVPIHKTHASLVKVPFKDIAMWSDVATPQGVIGVFKKPTHENSLHSQSLVLPLTLICDNIREPGNLGTILRSAVASRCEKILLTKGCVDLWEPKVLRSGAGAHFHMPITANLYWREIPNHLDENTTVHVADNKLPRDDLSSSQIDPKMVVPDHLLRRRGRDLGKRERKVIRDFIEEESRPRPVLELQIYHDVDWKAKTALVVGGETEGLSREALELCDHMLGCRVHIPMAEVMESLNVGVSASVILFEAMRQNLTLTEN